MASADYYLKIDTIEGESEAMGFEKQMQIESWSFGASNCGSSGSGTGLGVGKVSFQDFHFVVQNGKASVSAFLGYLQRQPHSAGDLELPQNGRRRNSLILITKLRLATLVISSFQTGGSNGSGVLPMEQFPSTLRKLRLNTSSKKPMERLR